MIKIRSAMKDHNTLRSLQNVIGTGPITGAVGSLDLQDVNISVLSKEINLAEELGNLVSRRKTTYQLQNLF